MESAAALYGICREIDDLADKQNNKMSAKNDLICLREALITRDHNHPMVAKALAIKPAITLDALIELTDGVLLDTEEVKIKSEAELYAIATRAGTVGLWMCDLFEVKDPVARHHAIDLGVAMQLTNICRDVKEDALNGRIYLPTDLLGSVNAEDIASPTATTGATVRHLVSYLLTEAEARYDSGISRSRLPTSASTTGNSDCRINLSRDWHGDSRPRFRRLDRSSLHNQNTKILIAFKGVSPSFFQKATSISRLP